jgi:L-alanine-DL-glutamate epimerase-like enolase superfamily enzyme
VRARAESGCGSLLCYKRALVRIAAREETLRLAETFTIANSSVDVEHVCVLTLEHEGVTAYGEGAPVDYWGESAGGIVAALEADGPALLGDDPWALERIAARLRDWDGPQGAKMALDGAVHDWIGKRAGVPVWRLLGLDPLTPETSFTIGIDTVEGTRSRVERAGGFAVLKVKVGGASDLERLEVVRAATGARLRIDANEGWTLDTALELLPRLIELGVEFVEQPFPAADRASYRAYRAFEPRLPVLIDEGCKDLASVAEIKTYADGIVIKLSKCGGIREAVRMIHAARALGLAVMLGCMIESELGIAQAAQLGSLVDYVDLDGHLLIENAPFTGLGLADGRLVLSAAPGLGVAPA